MKNNPSFTTTELRHLLQLSGELLNTTAPLDALHSIGVGVSRLFHPGALVIIVATEGDALAIEFDGEGVRRKLGYHAGLSELAQQLLASDTVSPSIDQAGGENRYAWAKFPPPSAGIILVSWPNTVQTRMVSSALAIVQDVAELTGAVMGKFQEQTRLRREIADQAQALEASSSAHALELDRRNKEEHSLRMLSCTDELTGLNNRRGFFLDAERSFQIAQRQRMQCAVIFADVDNLKRINDQQGHDIGDQLLCDVAAVLRKSFRKADVVARLGGDEFAAFTVADDCPDRIVERLGARLQEFNRTLPVRPYDVGLSTGIVRCDPDSTMSLADYLLDADKAMYAVKLERRSKQQLFTPAK
ncbi:GGDEF domain-containing protein [Oxalobacteraceae bacterium A2-2]